MLLLQRRLKNVRHANRISNKSSTLRIQGAFPLGPTINPSLPCDGPNRRYWRYSGRAVIEPNRSILTGQRHRRHESGAPQQGPRGLLEQASLDSIAL